MNTKTPLELAREAKAAKRESGELKVLNPIEKAADNPKSLRLAVNAFCWDCVGGDADPGPKQRVRDCAVQGCPLWSHRPWQKIKGRSGYSDMEDQS